MSCLFASLSLVLFASPAPAVSFDDDLTRQLARSAPNINRDVLQAALQATQCAVRNGVEEPERLAVIDFSLPSTERRLWIFDLAKGELLMRELVAHGKNSGLNRATEFSNTVNSYQSSIGLFRASESYQGKHGYSLRLDGLEEGINDRARERAIVIHGADYVDPSWIREHGRLGRSHGCPAVRQGVVQKVVNTLKGGQLVFKYYPEQRWLQSSWYLHCDEPQLASRDFDQRRREHREL
ncbi:MAG: murein L,D-transpeptidase catalytic domain family protein [Marinobacter sp.]|nr:murein L,D-transpeptidase catalytic domain family protein [Marinobacter sp.]MDX1636061.1 murein L,D-transpeptidase catalytic domain family protein [Marinobacter sp.]